MCEPALRRGGRGEGSKSYCAGVALSLTTHEVVPSEFSTFTASTLPLATPIAALRYAASLSDSHAEGGGVRVAPRIRRHLRRGDSLRAASCDDSRG
jgi:hypothetical protein